jgi:chromosome segregation ATPase
MAGEVPCVATLQEQLDEIEQAISDIRTKGQSVTTNGASLTRANLRDLLQSRSQLKTEIAQASTSRVRRLHMGPTR